MSENYKATVHTITNLIPLENCDNVFGTNIFGNHVIVDKNTKIGDVGIFFVVETKLSEAFLRANNLYRDSSLNIDNTKKGYFELNGRIRCAKFRKHASMGFWIPIDSLTYLSPVGTLVEGFEFDELCGEKICQKYIPANTKTQGMSSGQGKKPKESKIVDGQFHFHFDTSHLGRNLHKLSPEDQVVISWKLHGTSAIGGYVICKKSLKWYEKLLKALKVDIVDTHYDYLYASRKVVKNADLTREHVHFYSYDLWTETGKNLFEGKLHKGESVYYEIVGYTKDGGMIQGPFDYNCAVGELKTYVYRITQTNADGNVTELQWNQLTERCREIGVETVPLIFNGKLKEIIDPATVLVPVEEEETPSDYPKSFEGRLLETWRNELFEHLRKLYVYDQNSKFCVNTVPEEGIVLRKEGSTIECFKFKAVAFQEFETKQLDKGEVDMETVESEENE